MKKATLKALGSVSLGSKAKLLQQHCTPRTQSDVSGCSGALATALGCGSDSLLRLS